MAQFGDNITVVNRTRATILTVMWDGMMYHFDPGPTHNVPLPIAMAAYKQHPVHGTEDPLGDPESIDSLIGLQGMKAPYGTVTPMEQSTAGERIDRKRVPGVGGKAKRMDAGSPTYFDATRGVDRVDLQDDASTKA